MKYDWKTITIPSNLCNYSYVFNSYFIKCPHSSQFEGFGFWLSNKLISKDEDSAVQILYHDDFTFRLKKYGKGKYNKTLLLDSRIINAEEFEEAFKVLNYNISDRHVRYGRHVPLKLEPVHVEVLEEFIDD